MTRSHFPQPRAGCKQETGPLATNGRIFRAVCAFCPGGRHTRGEAPALRTGAGWRQPTISLPEKNCAISTAAFSTLSEPWAELASMDSANSLRMVPSAALAGLVAPITSR